MNNDELLQPLRAMLTQVQHLISLAQAEQWEALSLAAGEYEQQLALLGDDAYLHALTAAHLADDAKVIITKILTLNNDLDSYTLLQREKVASELRQLSQSGKALEAYGR